MSRAAFIGVDPGTTGAVACLTSDGAAWVVDACTSVGPLFAAALNGALQFADDAAGATIIRAAVEQVGVHPGEGVRSAFTFGQAAGVIDGALAMCPNVRTEYVRPQAWKAVYGIAAHPAPTPPLPANPTPAQTKAWKRAKTAANATAKRHAKTAARELAMRLWPRLAPELLRVKDAGRAEALLIAETIRRRELPHLAP